MSNSDDKSISDVDAVAYNKKSYSKIEDEKNKN